jgi:phosphoglycolate phosphatase
MPPSNRGQSPVNSAPLVRLAWLFDIDGTLLLTDGAARDAFARAVGERFPGPDPLGEVSFAGRIDPLILRDILAHHGATFDVPGEAAFWTSVYAHMQAVLTPGRGRVLDGVHEVLAAVAREPEWGAALLTGNTSEMARMKLVHFDLLDRFAFGAFGEEAEDRDRLARLAVARAVDRWGVTPAQCIVVGDTEHDVRCARFAGARAVAVASGSCSREVLAAEAPDLLLDDLRGPALLEWARTLE